MPRGSTTVPTKYTSSRWRAASWSGTGRFGPTTLPGSLSRRELAARYAERRGVRLGDMCFYYAFGLFKTAVVAQQIYARYRQGATRDPRFATFADGVRILARQAARSLRADS